MSLLCSILMLLLLMLLLLDLAIRLLPCFLLFGLLAIYSELQKGLSDLLRASLVCIPPVPAR